MRRRPSRPEPSQTEPGKVRSRHADIPQAARDQLRPIFRLSFLVIFLVLEWIVWEQVRQRPVRSAAAPHADRPAGALGDPTGVAGALFLAGTVTLAANMAVRLILTPLLNVWLRPGFDPSGWTFHLPAGETPAASVPARWRTGGRWRPGALVLTKRRLWFLPAGWDVEPWSIARVDVERVEARPPAFARFLPVHNWPDLLRFTATDRGSCILRRGRSRRGPGLVRADPDFPIPSRPAPAPRPRSLRCLSVSPC